MSIFVGRGVAQESIWGRLRSYSSLNVHRVVKARASSCGTSATSEPASPDSTLRTLKRQSPTSLHTDKTRSSSRPTCRPRASISGPVTESFRDDSLVALCNAASRLPVRSPILQSRDETSTASLRACCPGSASAAGVVRRAKTHRRGLRGETGRARQVKNGQSSSDLGESTNQLTIRRTKRDIQ